MAMLLITPAMSRPRELRVRTNGRTVINPEMVSRLRVQLGDRFVDVRTPTAQERLAAVLAENGELRTQLGTLRARGLGGEETKRFWIGVALQAAAGRATAGDVLMLAGRPGGVTKEEAEDKLGVGLESARGKLGAATANALIASAGLA